MMTKWLWVSGLVIVLDQASKAVAGSLLEAYQPVAVLPCFNLTLMYNTGAAFSFLSDASGWQRWFFSIVAVVVSTIIIAWMYRLRPDERWQAAALALILGGALGNLIDRLLLGHVVDFIQLYYDRWYWPAFNIADSAITVGAAMLVFDGLRTVLKGHHHGGAGDSVAEK